jgi:hypothetical protein
MNIIRVPGKISLVTQGVFPVAPCVMNHTKPMGFAALNPSYNYCFIYFGEQDNFPNNGGPGYNSTRARYCEKHNDAESWSATTSNDYARALETCPAQYPQRQIRLSTLHRRFGRTNCCSLRLTRRHHALASIA